MTVEVKLYVPHNEELPLGFMIFKSGRGMLFTIDEMQKIIKEAQELIDELERMRREVKQLAH